jgi:hypothetical protein
VATSETSALVGTGAAIIDSSIWVADHRLAGVARGAGNLLLQARNFLDRHFHAEIAAPDHDGVGKVDDVIEMLQRRRLLDLGHDRGAAAGELARLGDVLRTLDEGERDPADAERHGVVNVGAVLLGHGAEGKHGVGKADALAAAEQPRGHDLGVDADVARLDDAQPELAVVEQERMAGLHGREDLRMRQVHAAETADRFAADEAQHVAFVELDRARLELADAELGALQIDQDADGPRELGLQFAHDRVNVAQALMRGMTHVHAEHVGARLEQAPHGFFVVGGRPERCDDLDPAIAPHWGFGSPSGSVRRTVQSRSSPVSTSKKPVRL